MDGCLPLADGFVATPYRFLWHPATRTAILSDMHLGGEAELARQGIFLPPVAQEKLSAAWSKLAELLEASLQPSRVVIAGDIFDTDEPPRDTIRFFGELLHQLPPTCTATLLAGNHDPPMVRMTSLVADFGLSDRIAITTATHLANYAIFHGDQSDDGTGIANGRGQKMPGNLDNDRWIPSGLIVGHQHPALTLATRVQSAKMFCYAVATLRVNDTSLPLILLPPFSPLPLGSDLRLQRNWILDLPRPADEDIRIAGIIEPKEGPPSVLDFGPLQALSDLSPLR